MSLIPDIDYKIIETSTLQPLVYDSYYDWSFVDSIISDNVLILIVYNII